MSIRSKQSRIQMSSLFEVGVIISIQKIKPGEYEFIQNYEVIKKYKSTGGCKYRIARLFKQYFSNPKN